MARGKAPLGNDITTLQMALVGYQLERQKIDERIKELQAQLGGRRTGAAAAKNVAGEAAGPRKRNLSAAARRRIAMAQKRRWAEHRRKAAQAAKAAKAEDKA